MVSTLPVTFNLSSLEKGTNLSSLQSVGVIMSGCDADEVVFASASRKCKKILFALGRKRKEPSELSLFYLCAMKVSEVAHKLPWESSDKTTQLNKEGKRLGFLVSVSGKS